jgi:hypothetical protein
MNIKEQFNLILETPEVERAINKYVSWYNDKFDVGKRTSLTGYKLEVQKAKRWVKIWQRTVWKDRGVDEHTKSIFTFVDPETGEMFKGAGHRAPAKGVRANILDLESAKRATGQDGIGFGRLR